MMTCSDRIDPVPGLYILLAELPSNSRIKIGAQGTFDFPAGVYAYTGSAKGPGGLHARIRRHLLPPSQKKLHWHIDYLLQHALLQSICWIPDPAQDECEWAARVSDLGVRYPPQFGASDCSCAGHLTRLKYDAESTLPIMLSRYCPVARCMNVNKSHSNTTI